MVVDNNNLKNLIIGADSLVPLANGSMARCINFDNAATTPPFKSVIQEIINFAPMYSSIHRGTGYKSQVSTEIYERSREAVLDFVNGDKSINTVIYVKNTTEAINKLSNRLKPCNNKNVILSTDMEHHSNDLPWRNKFRVDYIKTDANGRLILNDLKKKLNKYKGRVRLVTISGASNVTGLKNDIHRAAELAHNYNALIHVDGAQLIPHSPFDMKSNYSKEHIDFLSFSAHKMYAPFGTGVLIGPIDIFKDDEPDYPGGGTVKFVTHERVIWSDPPERDEAGTPNLMGVVALLASIRILTSIGMNKIETNEKQLIKYTIEKLKDIKDIILYGDTDNFDEKVGIIPFNIKGIPHEIVAAALSLESGIAVRSGCFCAQPYIQRLLNLKPKEIQKYMNSQSKSRPGMVRISFGLYNTIEEVNLLADALDLISENREIYLKRYENLII